MRGDIFRLNSDRRAVGHEQQGPRFGVTVQADHFSVSTVIVAPTSTSAQPSLLRPEIELLGQTTRVMIDQMAAIDWTRLAEVVGRVTSDELAEIERAILAILALD